MIVVPLLNTLEIKNYGLFPGSDGTGNVSINFSKGLTLIAGVNGLGKTTLLTMLLRCISGPYDLTANGPPEEYQAIIPKAPVRLSKAALGFFSQRVADGAENATASLNMSFNGKIVSITRRLSDLELTEFVVSGEPFDMKKSRSENEQYFQKKVTDLFDLSSFQSVLLVLHNLLFFTENKHGALWDKNAQRHLLSAVLVGKKLSKEIDALGRDLNGADSRYRNTRAQHTRFDKKLNAAVSKEKSAPGTRKSLDVTNTAISGLRERIDVLEKQLGERYERRREKNQEHERAKQKDESSRGAVERAKYTSLMHSFPKMDDAARLLLARVLSKEICLVCGADAPDKRESLEDLLAKGFCPICESDPDHQKHMGEAHEFEQAKMEKAIKVANRAEIELATADKAFTKVDQEYSSTMKQLTEVRDELSKQLGTKERLELMLPTDSDRVQNLRQTVNGLKKEMNAEHIQVLEAVDRYDKKLNQVRKYINKSGDSLSEAFGNHIEGLFAESARLSRVSGEAKMGELPDSKFDFPRFVTAMTAADRNDFILRYRKTDVSESQRELVDLAFRLAVFDVVTASGEATFIMETPEASLDGIAMNKVGEALHKFSSSDGKRLIVTNNLTNTGMLTSLFGGKIPLKKMASESKRRYTQIFNLLVEAAPNRAVEQNGDDYQKLLDDAVTGHVQ